MAALFQVHARMFLSPVWWEPSMLMHHPATITMSAVRLPALSERIVLPPLLCLTSVYHSVWCQMLRLIVAIAAPDKMVNNGFMKNNTGGKVEFVWHLYDILWFYFYLLSTSVSVMCFFHWPAGPYDPCNRPDFCNIEDNDVVADPDDCNMYYDCPNGLWRRVPCSPSHWEFDNKLLLCVQSAAECAPKCSEYTGPPTPPTTPMSPGKIIVLNVSNKESHMGQWYCVFFIHYFLTLSPSYAFRGGTLSVGHMTYEVRFCFFLNSLG